MSSSGIPRQILEKTRGIRVPKDYFADTRSGLNLWPEKILCFTRKSRLETVSEPLARHHHHRYVMVVPLHGSGTVYVDDCRYLLSHPKALLILPFQFHHGFNFDQPQVLWLIVTFEIRNGSPLEALRLEPLRKMEAEDLSLLFSFVEAWSGRGRDNELAYWLGLFLNRMLGAPPCLSLRMKPKKNVKSTSSLILRINQHCMSHLDQSIGLKELAERLTVSESYLRARFRKETGMSLGQHLRRLRLQKAIGFLLQSELSISEIAERCGFDSIFSFSRSFRQFSGIPATDYRRRFIHR